jgi:exosome complex component RRP4
MILVEDRNLVLPGTKLAEGSYSSDVGTYKEKDAIYASVLGIAYVQKNTIRVVPLEGKYMPKVDDPVLGVIVDEYPKGWIVDLECPYRVTLDPRDIFEKRFSPIRIGDLIYGKIFKVTETYEAFINAKRPYGRLEGGRLVKIHPSRVPRLIGRGGSMIIQIKDHTKCDILVGQNGLVWLLGKPENEEFAAQIVQKVDREAHTSGLTDRVGEMLKRKS